MKNFEYKVGDKVINIRFDEARGTVAEFLVDGATAQPTEEQMPAYAAAIALALIEHEVEPSLCRVEPSLCTDVSILTTRFQNEAI